jgi:hypothetical protein
MPNAPVWDMDALVQHHTASDEHTDDRRHEWHRIACLLAMPAMLLAADPNLFVNPGGNGYIDPWVYTGLFISLPALARRFGETYYASRLPWLLPGFAAHSAFPPLLANYVLHFSFFLVLLFAAYALVSRGVDRRAGFLAAVLMAGSPTILAALSWDYVDGAGIVFLVLTLCCLSEAARGGPRRTIWAMAAGASTVCLIGSNLSLVLLLPACAAFLVAHRPDTSWTSIARIVVVAIAGAIASLALFGLVNQALGGQWFFLDASIKFVQLIRRSPNPWRTNAFNWMHAPWLVLPAYAAIGAVVHVTLRWRRSSPFARSTQVALLVACATWVVVDAFGDSVMLQYFYYTSYLAPLALIALVAQAGSVPRIRTLRGALALELASVAIVVLAHVVSRRQSAEVWIRLAGLFPSIRLTLMGVVTGATLLAGLAGIVILLAIRPPRLRWAAFFIAVVASFSGLSQFWPTGDVPTARADFADTVSAHRFIATTVGGDDMRIWSAEPAATAPPFQSIASTFLWTRLLVNADLPKLTAAEADAIPLRARLVMLVRGQSDADAARAAMQRLGIDYLVVAQQHFGRDGRQFLVIVADVVRSS